MGIGILGWGDRYLEPEKRMRSPVAPNLVDY